MKTLLKIEVDEQGFGRSDCDIHSEEEEKQLITCLLSMIVRSEDFRRVIATAFDIYIKHTAEITDVVKKSSVFYNNDNKHNS